MNLQKKLNRFVSMVLSILLTLSVVPLPQAYAGNTYLIKFKNGTATEMTTSRVVYAAETDADNRIAPTLAKEAEKSFDWPGNKALTGWYVEGDTSKTAVDFSTHQFKADTTLLPIYVDQISPYVFFQSDGLQTTFLRVNKGDPILKPADPVRTGYTFQYWSLDGMNAFDFSTPITQNTTLYAVWKGELVDFKVLFYVEKPNMEQDGTPGDFTEYNYLEMVTLQGVAGEYTNLVENRAISGLDSYFNGGVYSTGLKYTELQAAEDKIIEGNGNTVINAFVKRKTYRIFYDLDQAYDTYGMIINGETITALDDTYYVDVKFGNLLNGPSKATTYFSPSAGLGVASWYYDYDMSGWNSGAYRTLMPSQTLTKELVSHDGQKDYYIFRAYWSNVPYKHSVRRWYEPLGPESDYRITMPDTGFSADVRGKEFFLKENEGYDHYWTTQGSVYFVSKVGFTPLNAYYGTSVNPIAAMPHIMYQDNDELKFYFTWQNNSYTTYNYFFSRNSYNLSFDMQSGTAAPGVNYSDKLLKYETPLADYELPAPVRDGYEFLGWYENLEFTVPFDFANSIMPAKSFTVFAKWRPIVNEYTVNFYNYYGGDIIDTQVVRAGEYTENKSSYYQLGEVHDYGTFDGWLYQINNTEGTSSKFSFALPVYEDMDVYASWNPGHYAVTYDLAGGTGTTPLDADNYAPGTMARVATNKGFSRSGYKFTGWNTKADGAGDAYSISDILNITGDVKLYAQWDKSGGTIPSPNPGGSSYTVTYDANGGTGSHKDTGLSSGTNYSVKSQDVTGIKRENKTFTGWNTKADGTGTAYAAADTIKITSNVILYAQWKDAGVQLDKDNHMAYIIGYPDGMVRPQNTITRAETTTIFFRLLTETSRSTYWATSNGFTDVSTANWYNNAASTMSKAGIVAGYTDGTFGADRSITRAEFAAIAARFDSSTYTGNDKFSDISGHWAAEYINRAAEKGWITGYEDGTFKPDQNITRAEAMTLVNRVLERANIKAMHEDMVKWSDNVQGAWYYEAVQEATNSHLYTRDASGAESWTQVLKAPDWAALEKAWSTANAM